MPLKVVASVILPAINVWLIESFLIESGTVPMFVKPPESNLNFSPVVPLKSTWKSPGLILLNPPLDPYLITVFVWFPTVSLSASKFVSLTLISTKE